MGNELLTGDKKADFALRQEAIARATADPLPGPLTNAFAKGAIKVGGDNVRKIVASDWTVFKQIDSPLLRMVQELQQNPGVNPNVDFTELEQQTICWQFLNHPKRVREIIEAGTLKETVIQEIADEYDAGVLNLILFAVMEQMKRGWQTALKYSAALEESGEVTFFRDASPGTKMDSAGGSTTTPGS